MIPLRRRQLANATTISPAADVRQQVPGESELSAMRRYGYAVECLTSKSGGECRKRLAVRAH